MSVNRIVKRRIIFLLPALWLAACATTTPYQALHRGVGYSEQKLESNRFRVNFAGSSFTSRETVENYVLYRAAELTLANSYDWFSLASQNTEQEVNSTGPSIGFGIGGIGLGHHSVFGLGIGTGADIYTEYNGTLDVLMFSGKKPDNNPHAYDARQLKTNLEAVIVRPKPSS